MLARNIPGVALALIIAYVGAKSSHLLVLIYWASQKSHIINYAGDNIWYLLAIS